MNKKITRQLGDIDKTEAKLKALQKHLEDLQASLKEDEDQEIIRSIRGLNLTGWGLAEMLEGIKDGTVKFVKDETAVQAKEQKKKTEKGTDSNDSVPEEQVPESAPESEEYQNEN
ncbi:MAG: DUF4315 family protein [Oscillospiraceae bacterium]|nr:DUF4315 family protein [Oscillospiraceae bacterium]